MSILPPTPIILSKLKYHILNRFKDDSSLDSVLEKLGPYPVFQLKAEFRSLENGTINKLVEISKYIESETIQWDCVDTALNMYTRMRKHLREAVTSPGVIRLSIVHKPENSENEWNDLYLDEHPINVKGIRDENGKELAL